MNSFNKLRHALVCVAICSVATLASAQDNAAAREAAADRYLRVAPISKMLDDDEIAKQLPRDKRAEFMAVWKAVVLTGNLERIVRESMIKIFTADELNALADFWGSKYGSSAFRKFNVYMEQITPVIQSEFQRATEQYNAQQKK